MLKHYLPAPCPTLFLLPIKGHAIYQMLAVPVKAGQQAQKHLLGTR